MNIEQHIIEEMKVKPVIDPEQEIEDRIKFIQNIVKDANAKSIVLGISGGVDSSLCGKLCQIAMDRLGEDYKFIAVRLPYKKQQDELDAQRALQFIQPAEVVTTDISSGVDGIFNSVSVAVSERNNSADFVKGNVKARMRMIAQYAIASFYNGLVAGTDHSAEAVMGFYTKHGDGACDFAPLFGLNKRQVRLLCEVLGAPENIYNKAATADLEDLDPGALDEDRLGVSYDAIDDFLEGKEVDNAAKEAIIKQYAITQHKRNAIPTIHG